MTDEEYEEYVQRWAALATCMMHDAVQIRARYTYYTPGTLSCLGRTEDFVQQDSHNLVLVESIPLRYFLKNEGFPLWASSRLARQTNLVVWVSHA